MLTAPRLLDLVLQHAPFAFYWKDSDLNFLGCNQRFAEAAGFATPKDIVGKSEADMPWQAQERSFARESDETVLRTSAPLLDLVHTRHAADGAPHTLRTSKHPICDDSGMVTGIMGISEDITEPARIEAELQNSNERFSQAVRLARLGYHLMDVTTDTVIFCSPEYAEMHGVSVDQFEAVADSEEVSLVHVEDRPRYTEAIRQVRNGAQAEIKYRVVWPDGTVRHVHEIGEPVFDANNRVVQEFWTIRDVTEEIEAAERLSQAQRTEAVGQLTGGLAHDFNNLLAVIRGNLELFLSEAEKRRGLPVDQAEMLRSAIEATTRGGDLTRKMLAFARKSTLRPRLIDVTRIVEETRSWLSRTIPSNIMVETDFETSCWPALLDPTELQSAIVNVVVNARDAMPEGGTLKLMTMNRMLDGPAAVELDHGARPGPYVVLRISDTGSGIPPGTIDRIFDPFFTTKAEGIGTGLGLSMVHGFVRQSDGVVQVHSEPDAGTSFELYFPARPEDSCTGRAQSDESGTGEEAPPIAHILLVEDQPEVLAVMERTLLRTGHSVDTATNADAALARIETGVTYDLLISDIVMPGSMHGPDLARRLRDMGHDLPVIFVSGYADKLLESDMGEGDVLLMKPVPRATLLDAVNRQLDRARQA